jgi:N-acetyltransferase 10
MFCACLTPAGEHTCVMLQALAHPDVPNTSWLQPFVSDFKSRFISLLAGAFKGMAPALALSLLNPKLVFSDTEASAGVQQGVMVTRGDGRQLSPYDLKRLQVRGC